MNGSGDPGPPKSVVIAGGGLIGLSIAWRLAQAGFDVSLFDQGVLGGEASWAGAGMLAPGGELEGPSVLAPLALEARQMYSSYVHELEDLSGHAIDYQDCGALELAYSQQDLEDLQQRSSRQAPLGIASKELSADQIKIFWPRLRAQGLLGGRFYPGDGIVNPRDLVSALLSACAQAGVVLKAATAIQSVALEAESVAVVHGNSRSSFDAVVIAAGAWSSSIPVSGVPPLPAVEPVRGHLLGYAQPLQTCNSIVRHRHTYLLQRSNGLLIAGASVEHVGFDRNTRFDIASALAEDAAFLLPHLAETTPSEVWIGFRPASDTLHVGSWHSKHLYLAYGHYRNGILLAPVTAKRLVSEISANLRTHESASA